MFERIAVAVAFALLIVQASVPWMARYFVTQDGPSHVYTAAVAWDLVTTGVSPYARAYRLQPGAVGNWATPALLNLFRAVAGATHAEKLLFSASVIAFFFAFAYLLRSLDPNRMPWSPLIVFLGTPWMLWIGFYNFYLGMALLMVATGLCIRVRLAQSPRTRVLLAVGLCCVMLVHPLAGAIGLIVIAVTGGWRLWPVTVPAALLLALFVQSAPAGGAADTGIWWAWVRFPMHVFGGYVGKAGEQTILWPAVLFLIVAGIAALSADELRHAAIGRLAVVCVAMFVLYLTVPNSGFGGDEIKIRFSWACFLFGVAVALSSGRLRAVRPLIELYAALFIGAHVVNTGWYFVHGVSPMIEDVDRTMSVIPPGSTVVRLRFPSPGIEGHYGYGGLLLDPSMHADAWVAARRKLIALSDYQPLTGTFPVVLRSEFGGAPRSHLLDLEGSTDLGPGSLRKILEGSLPISADYVVLIGDATDPQRGPHFAPTVAMLNQRCRLSAESRFVRVWRTR